MKIFSSDGASVPAQMSHTILRVAAAMCFIGHGAFGIITKPVWCNYFAVFGIGHDMAYHMMPIVGTMDILFGLTLLFYPTRAAAGWLVIWGIVTASLRPLSGEPFAELIERAGNYGAPLVLLLLSMQNGRNAGRLSSASGSFGEQSSANQSSASGFIRNLFSRLRPNPSPDSKTMRRATAVLQVAVFLLLLGHGWLNLIEKKGIIQQYTGLGFSDPMMVARIVGLFEIAAAVTILIRPIPSLLIVLFIWKMGTELFYPHWEVFEWVERGGSYGCLLALWVIETAVRQARKMPATSVSIL